MVNKSNVFDFFNNPDQYIKENPIIELRAYIIKDKIGEKSNLRFIDIGCGNGMITMQYIKDNKITFVDLSPKMIEIAKRNTPENSRLNANFIHGDFTEFEINEKFDFTICIGVISHVADINKLLFRLKAITNDTGQIILQYTDSNKLIARINDLKTRLMKKNNYQYSLNRLNSRSIQKILAELDLTVIHKVNYWPVSPFFLIFNYRLKIFLLKRFYKSPFLSKFGSETILFLEKNN